MGKTFSAETGALFLRLVVGLTFFYYGGQKMFGWFGGDGWQATIQSMMRLDLAGHHVPEWLAMAAPITEFVGGCCILVGLLTRFWGAGLAIDMIAAIILLHGPSGLKHGWLGKDGLIAQVQFPLALGAMSMALFLGGPGKLYLADIEGWALGVKGGGGGKAKKPAKE